MALSIAGRFIKGLEPGAVGSEHRVKSAAASYRIWALPAGMGLLGEIEDKTARIEHQENVTQTSP